MLKRKFTIALIAVISLVAIIIYVSCTRTDTALESKIIHITWIELLSNPNAYHGNIISLTGSLNRANFRPLLDRERHSLVIPKGAQAHENYLREKLGIIDWKYSGTFSRWKNIDNLAYPSEEVVSLYMPDGTLDNILEEDKLPFKGNMLINIEGKFMIYSGKGEYNIIVNKIIPFRTYY